MIVLPMVNVIKEFALVQRDIMEKVVIFRVRRI